MYTTAILIGIILLSVGAVMFLKARKKNTVLLKYESDNCSPDGEVTFDSLESSRIHTSEKGLYKFLSIIGSIIGLLGLSLIVAGLNF